ncbi:ribosomal protein L9 [Synechococcus sp. PCC 7502]|uniref:50S ribosomal protein L9 n=1 Tax=Synechococcus sp. PCC 7502 TaxID=1173263 RepID=UPI00029FA00E|nr:50S ribosomal protein L9 [Synechococcus sp. PCC 7502]AFY74009.1 ribosomal protein L9 [Synechococcus sp. PCC 7502]
MAKSDVQVMLTKDVVKLGKLGDLVNVAPGYAQNYLLPNGLAVRATAGINKEVERRKEKERQRLIAIRQEAEGRKATLSSIGTLIVKKAVGDNKSSIFGSVTDREVAQLILAKSTLEIDRREITVPDIKQVGTYDVEIKLHAEVTATVKVQVVPE